MNSTETLSSVQQSAESVQTNTDYGTAFWTTPGTQAIGTSVLVKRFDDGGEDNIHIMRINKDYLGSKFKFPSSFIPVLVERLKGYLEKLEYTDDKKWKIPGIEKITSWEELTSDEFWAGDDYIKIAQLRIKPFLAAYGSIQFRLWNEVANYQTFENPDGSTKLWRGSAASISVAVMKKLVAVLEKLENTEPEKQTGINFFNV